MPPFPPKYPAPTPATTPAVREFAFDVTLMATIRVKAETLAAARQAIRSYCDVMDCNGGAWPNGDPILFEAGVDGALDLIEIDGEAV